jgi:phage/plasmid-like protein (TIGR03299 family)
MSSDILFADLLPAATPARQEAESTTTLPVPRHNPWQRVGRSFPPTSDAQEALHRAGLAWNVDKVGLRTDDLAPVPDHVAIRRSDTGRVLGVVGADYEPLQNAAAFAFFRDLAGDSRLTFETAGAFQGGSIVWIQAKLPDLRIALGDDVSDSYLFISNGHTGNRTLTIAPTTIRIVCQNTLRMAEAQHDNQRRRRPGLEAGFTVRHTRGMPAALADIQEAYARTLRAHTGTRQAYQHLAARPLTSRLETAFFAQVFPTGPDERERAKAIAKTRRDRLAAILASPTSQVRGTVNTAFSLFQAAVEYIDHDRTTRTATGTPDDAIEQRLVSATFGSGADRKGVAWDAILALTAA